MNLLCLSDFNQGDITAKAGEIVRVPLGLVGWLLDSWPGYWQLAPIEVTFTFDNPPAPVETAAVEAPPVDKMIHAPTKAKGKRRG